MIFFFLFTNWIFSRETNNPNDAGLSNGPKHYYYYSLYFVSCLNKCFEILCLPLYIINLI
ncbi:hypothetical protein HanXRQr2_Chr10g0464731 [Helianthus annuus]|uniref:Uncharacterized protein n=1 Tax=Helianthus annuus TaxID=4232 RepID=A0A9K3I2B3_HELAN|nr:hypothetical protein HanXRQr2_Chr10g0464731 [Helianthus annuus]